MQTSLEQFVLSDFSLRLTLLLVVIVIERYFHIPPSYHPGTLLRHLTLSIASKVNKRGQHQQTIAGIISTVLVLSLVLGACFSILYFAMLPMFFEALFLLLMLNARQLLECAYSIKTSLDNNKKNLAREQLNQLCIRDSDTLSTMGVIKATIEGIIQRVSQNYFNIIIYYAVFGIYSACIVAIFNTLAHTWNPKKQKFRHFGQFSSNIAKVLNTPIQIILCLLLALLYGFKHLALRHIKWHRYGAGALLTTSANVLKRELGGAVMYDNIKIRRAKLGSDTLPQINDIKHTHYIISQLQHSMNAVLVLTLLTDVTLNLL